MKKFLPFKKFCMTSNVYALLSHYFDEHGSDVRYSELTERMNWILEAVTCSLRHLYDGRSVNLMSVASVDAVYGRILEESVFRLAPIREV